MNSKYTLLSKSNKLIAWILAIFIGLFFSIMANTTFLQDSMFGKWKVTESMFSSDSATKIEYVTISSYSLTIGDDIQIPIKYNSKSSNASFVRIKEEKELYYYFKKNREDEYYSVIIKIDKSDKNRMELLVSDRLNPDMPTNEFTLERSE